MNIVSGCLWAVAALVPATACAATDARESAHRFVAQMAIPAQSDEPLARFTYPLCVGSAGLPAEAGEVVIDRIAEVAASAGLPVAAAGCAPNLMVVFVEDSRAAVQRLSHGRSGAMIGQLRADIRRILEQPGPVRAWIKAAIRSRDGDRPSYSPTGVTTLKTETSTHLSSTTRRDIVSSVVLIDREAMADRDLRQVADYAAIRGLTGAHLGEIRAEGPPTILTLFTSQGDADAPPGLTAADRAFLSAFYTVRADMAEPLQRQRIADHMARTRPAEWDGAR
ncbi:hypothetical protein [Novosphingobium sp. ST904]|uniref:hypothetical protein n=1 Tax=Novosphingobium sp. ST904 TaxID=1684385 RepID=UPI0010437C49|nr:hypothetical protein [Novosphingobium sp. ST904]TCM41552.1 hypothetical protein EDF59_103304 [Novosphingobium sp. ST904]